ncbi:MAG TPA: methyltransferase domain-containing protein [Syntrophorhabdales bacterium]|nr:methyltransferase domain-containing protein [Syntrophorhabdales bacterium]
MVICCDWEIAMERHVPGAGKSSFDLIDSEKLFERLSIEKGSTLVDLGCGPGEYVIEAALHIGQKGKVYGLDLWEEGLVALVKEAESRGLSQITVLAADICAMLPLQDQSVDVCLVATVLHDLVREGCAGSALEEARRILRPNGVLAVVEFKKFDGHPGPPIDIKLSPDQLGQIVDVHGFTRKEVVEVGPYNYLAVFRPAMTCSNASPIEARH